MTTQKEVQDALDAAGKQYLKALRNRFMPWKSEFWGWWLLRRQPPMQVASILLGDVVATSSPITVPAGVILIGTDTNKDHEAD